MLSGDFELVDSDHDQESKESKDSSFDDLRGSPSAAEESDKTAVEVNPECKEVPAVEQPSVAERTEGETPTDAAAVSEKAGGQESVDTEPVSSNIPAAAAPQPSVKKSGSKSSRSIAKIADPTKEDSESSTGILSKTSDVVSQVITSSEKVAFIPFVQLRSCAG
jgi:hypothetical protein